MACLVRGVPERDDLAKLALELHEPDNYSCGACRTRCGGWTGGRGGQSCW